MGTLAEMILEERPNSIHIDIDKIGHKSHNDEKVKNKLINTLVKKILINENIDRKKLVKIVFSNKNEMKKLENITWNYMEEEIDKIKGKVFKYE